MLDVYERTMLRDLKNGKCPEFYSDMVAVAQVIADRLVAKGYITIAATGRRRVAVVK